MGIKREIVGIQCDDGYVSLGELFCGYVVKDIVYKRDAIAGVTSGAPDTYIYHVSGYTDNEEDVKRCSCIPFRSVTRIDYIETKQEEEQPSPEAV